MHCLCKANREIINLNFVFSLNSLLVLRRRVSAKRRTIVFSTVRPSLQQIIELSKKISSFLYVQWNYKTNEPCPSVRLSVCLSTPRCTTLYGRVLTYPSIDFVFLWHMEQTYIGAVLRRIIFEKSQKLEFWRIFEKMVILGTLRDY